MDGVVDRFQRIEPDISGTIAAGQSLTVLPPIPSRVTTISSGTTPTLDWYRNQRPPLHVIGVDDDNPEIRVQRIRVATQYTSIMNEVPREPSSAVNLRVATEDLYLQSVHDGSGAAGSTNISIRTGAASGPTERISILDNDASFIVQSGTIFVVDDGLRVGFTGNIPTSDYSISANKAAADVSGGLFSTSIGESAISNTNAGWWLSAAGMNTTSKYTPALKFDPDSNHHGRGDYWYLPAEPPRPTLPIPTVVWPSISRPITVVPWTCHRMTINEDGKVGIGIEDPTHLTVNGGTTNNLALFESTDATARISFRDNGTSSVSHVGIGALATMRSSSGNGTATQEQ